MDNKGTSLRKQDTSADAGGDANTESIPPEVMTLAEVARYLRLAEKTVLRMVHRREIPCAKVASQWRFLRPMIDDWLTAKMQVVPRNDLAALIANGSELVPLSRLVREELIELDVQPSSKEQVLRRLIRPLLNLGIVAAEASYLEKLMERERMASTALGRGAAVPHLRRPQDNPVGGPVLVVGICRQGTDFEAPGGEKTHLFLLLCTDSEVVHLRVLARLTRLLRNQDLVQGLVMASNRKEVMGILIQADQEGEKL